MYVDCIPKYLPLRSLRDQVSDPLCLLDLIKIDFLWNTNWEDQSAQNAKKLSSLILASPTLASKVELFDWAAIVKQEFQSKGIAGMFNKIRSKATAAVPATPARRDDDYDDDNDNGDSVPSSQDNLSSTVQIKREPEIKPEFVPFFLDLFCYLRPISYRFINVQTGGATRKTTIATAPRCYASR